MSETRLQRLTAALDGPIGDPLLPALAEPAAWRALAAGALGALPLGGVLGDQLDALAVGPLAEGLLAQPGRSVLLGELALNLHSPGRINQGRKGTCAATCIESWLAESMPGEYARLIVGLAAPEGAVALRSGEALQRDEDALAWDAEEAGRSPVSRLFQVACMELAVDDLDYCNVRNQQVSADGEDAGLGLKLAAFDRLLEVITGQQWDMISDLHSRLLAMMGMADDSLPDLHKDGPGIIRRSLSEGVPVFVTLRLTDVVWQGQAVDAGHITHKVRLVGMDGEQVVFDDPLDPDQPWFGGVQAVLINDQGRASMGMDDLMSMIVELSYQPRFFAPTAAGKE